MTGVNRETFNKIILMYKNFETNLDAGEKVFPMLYESWLCDSFWKCHTMLLKAYFNKDGVELITDWLCNSLIAYQGKPVETSDDLWEIVKEYKND